MWNVAMHVTFTPTCERRVVPCCFLTLQVLNQDVCARHPQITRLLR